MTFPVSNNHDTGDGSLRNAILLANASPGLDKISFSIDSGQQKIQPLSPLPPIMDPVMIDGTTQPGYGGVPLIELDGSLAGTANGLFIQADGCTVQGLDIDRFQNGEANLVLQDCAHTWVRANYLGIGPGGSAVVGNTERGVSIIGSTNNIGSSHNTIGGTSSSDRNVISDGLDGVYITGSSTENLVDGNYIGTDPTGENDEGNTYYGVRIELDAGLNTIGGPAAGAGNVVSGNDLGGIVTSGTPDDANHHNQMSAENLIEGNKVGTDELGSGMLLNGIDGGIDLSTAGNQVIGNLVSGNVIGINLTSSASMNNVITGNLIGTNAAGTSALPNAGDGIDINNMAHDNTIGGTNAADRNIISGNGANGIEITGIRTDMINVGADHNVVEGNVIGLGANGTQLIKSADMKKQGNLQYGVVIENNAANETIGGTAAGAGNVIAGNELTGIYFLYAGPGNLMEGNLVGTDASGDSGLGNLDAGIKFEHSPQNIVGGDMPASRNVISGNPNAGIAVWWSDSIKELVEGNYIGTTPDGMNALANGVGITIEDGSNNTVGGTVAGSGNVISGNSSQGIRILAANSTPQAVYGTANVVEANFIGTDKNGTSKLGNTTDGIWIGALSSNNTIGGTGTAGNVISANGEKGVRVDTGATENLVAGNVIGGDVNGTTPLGNHEDGIALIGVTGNTVGIPGAGNTLIGNSWKGVRIDGGSSNNVVQANLIGTNLQNSTTLGNREDGIYLADSINNTIGGATNSTSNVIANSAGAGIIIAVVAPGANASGNTIASNDIGTDLSDTASLGNKGDGIRLGPGVTSTTVESNSILNNGGAGVTVLDATGGNTVRFNQIDDNGGLGIDIDGDGIPSSSNGPGPPTNYPVLTAVLAGSQTYVTGSMTGKAGATYNLDFYASAASDPSGYGEGDEFLGTTPVTMNASGTASFSTLVDADFSPGSYVTATATDAQGNTSEFSAAVPAVKVDFAELVVGDGTASYVASSGIDNALTLSLDQGTYAFVDLGEPIVTLGDSASACTGSGTNIVYCPDTAIRTLSIDVGDGNNSLAIQSASAGIAVYAEGSSDSVTIGNNGDGLASVTGAVNIAFSEGGTQSLMINDRAFSFLASYEIDDTGLVFDHGPQSVLVSGDTSLELDVSGRGSSTNVESMAAPTTIVGGASADVVNVTPTSEDLRGIEGLTVDGNGGADDLVLDDTNDEEAQNYTMASDHLDVNGVTRVTFDSGESVTLDAAGDAPDLSDVDVTGTPAGTAVTINLEPLFNIDRPVAELSINFTPDFADLGSVGSLIVNGRGVPTASGNLIVDDTRMSPTSYSIDDGSITPADMVLAPVRYTALDSVELQAAGSAALGGSDIAIEGTAPNLPLTVVGSPGNDTFEVSPGAQQIARLEGGATLLGNGGTDDLTIDDQSDSSGEYTMDSRSLNNIHFFAMAQVTLNEGGLPGSSSGLQVYGTTEETQTTINGSPANDSISVDVGPSLQGGLTIHGAGQNDQLTVKDWYDTSSNVSFRVSASAVTSPDSAEVSFDTLQKLEIDLGDNVESGSRTVNIVSTGPATTVVGGPTDDAVEVRPPKRYLSALAGKISFDGGSGAISLDIDARSQSPTVLSIAPGVITIANQAVIDTENVQTTTVHLGGTAAIGGSTVDLEGAAQGTQTTIDGSPGNDVIDVGGTSTILPLVEGSFDFEGGGGTDSVTIDDTANTGDSLASIVTDQSMVAWVSGSLTYKGVSSLTLDLGGKGRYSNQGDGVFIEGTAVGTTTVINGSPTNNEFDVYNIPPGTDLSALLGGPLTIDGGGGIDSLNLRLKPYHDTYTITAASFKAGQPAGTSTKIQFRPPINYMHIENLTLDLSEGTATTKGMIDVNSTGSGVSTIIIGSPGHDDVAVGVSKPSFTFYGGAGGSDSLIGPNLANTWNIPTSMGGVGTLNGNIKFQNVWSLKGGTGADTFVFPIDAGGTFFVQNKYVKTNYEATGLIGSIDGGGGVNNTLDYSRADFSVFVNLSAQFAANVSDAGHSFVGVANIQKVIGGNSDDVLIGDSGNNALTGNAGNDILLGLGGNDSLMGGRGEDLLVGGTSKDVLDGGLDGDILIAGDILIPGGLPYLQQILQIWTSGDSFTNRINRLSHGSGSYLTTTTIVQDDSGDKLTGDAGYDWFIVGLTHDAVTDATAGDLVFRWR
jgi:hypothetical protein